MDQITDLGHATLAGDASDCGSAVDDYLQLKLGQLDSIGRLYSLGEKIGEGSFGQVFVCRELSTTGALCVKVVPLDGRKSRGRPKLGNRSKGDFIQALLAMEHRHIVRYHRFFETDNRLYTIMSRCFGPDLPDFVAERGDSLAVGDVKRLSRQILDALRMLQSLGLAHRDIKPANFRFQDADAEVLQLLDLGFATFMSSAIAQHTITGTLCYAAPEVFSGRYGLGCDLWSAGAVVYELYKGRPPFETSDVCILKALHRDPVLTGDGLFRDACWTAISPSGKAIVRGLLTVDPNERLGAAEALESCWFAEPDAIEEAAASTLGAGRGLRRSGVLASEAKPTKMRRSYFVWNLSNYGSESDEPEEEPAV